MTSSYRNLDSWEVWDEYGWTLENDSLPSDQVFSLDYGDLATYSHHEPGLAPSGMQHHYTSTTGGLAPAAGYIAPHTNAWGQQSESSVSSPATESFNDATRLLQFFNHLPPRAVPSETSGLQRQEPRSEGDLYTAPFIKGEGVERMGWCSFCSSWHKLKDSAYWYHLHYSHGVSCFTGGQMIGPQKIQWSLQSNGWQGLCPRCDTWLSLAKGDRAAKTAYYRHAYLYHVKSNPQFERSSGVKKSRSPRRIQTKENSHV